MKTKNYLFYTLTSTDEPDLVQYVGTTQNTLKRRFQGHKGKARGKNRSQPVHHWMYKKYEQGFDIICTQIDECSPQEWEEREKYWISYYRKINPGLLNLQKGGAGVVTKEMRTIDGMERTRLASIKPVAAYTDTGELVKEFESVTEASKYVHRSKTAIVDALKGKTTHCAGYVWKYLDKKPIIEYAENKKKDPNYNKRVIVYKFDINNNLITTYQSIRQVIRDVKGEDTEQSGDYLAKKILDKSKLWEGYYWATSENFIINDTNFYCKEVTKDGDIVNRFRYKKDAAEKFGCDPSTITYWIDKHKELKNGNFIEKY